VEGVRLLATSLRGQCLQFSELTREGLKCNLTLSSLYGLRAKSLDERLLQDRYGRTVARVYCAGVDANAAMVRDGMTRAHTKYLTDPKMAEIEEQARVERTGLWADASPVAPWKWRTPIRPLRFDPNREWRCFPVAVFYLDEASTPKEPSARPKQHYRGRSRALGPS
jgi:hypothetical protein